MRKWLSLLLLILPVLVQGQTTTVTGTAKDANSVAYANGTVSAVISLNTGQALPAGVPASGSIGPFNLTGTGTFSVTVASPFTWTFTICAAPPSVGPRGNPTPTQVCFTTAPIAISGGSQDITTQINAVPPPILGPSGGGGISSVSSLPALPCTEGSTVYLNTGTKGNYTCISGVWIGPAVPFLNGSIIDATNPVYGLKYNTVWVIDATFNGTTTVQTGTNDPCFVSASDPGKQIEGTTWGGNDASYPSSVLAFNETTIASVTDCHHAVLTAGTPSACAAACTLGWGTKDDTAIAAVWTAATGNPGLCKSIWWPSAAMWLDSPQFNTNAGNCAAPITGPGRMGLQFAGQGGHEAGTTFVLGSTFSLASCVTDCFFHGLTGIKLTSFAIFGLGNPVGGSTTANVLNGAGLDTEIDDVELAGYGDGDTGLTCANLNNIDVRWLIVDGCGATALQTTNHVGMHQSFFGNQGSNPVFCNSSGGFHVESHGTGYALTAGSNGKIGITLNSGCNWVSQGDVFVQNTPTNGVCIKALVGSTADLTGLTCTINAGTTTTALWANGGKIVARSSQIGGSSQAVLADNTTGLYIDDTPAITIYTAGAINATSPACATADSNILACANLTAQTNNIAATTLFTTPSTAFFNQYDLTYDLIVTTAGTSGTITVNLICPNGTATATQAGAATLAVTATAGSEASGTLSCHAATSSAIQYSVTGITTPGTLAYSLNLRLRAR